MLALLAIAAATATAQPPPFERTPNFYRPPAGCEDATQRVVDRFGRPVAFRLGDLPVASALLLVDRRVDGCPVITVMRRGNGTAPNQELRSRPAKPNLHLQPYVR